MASFELNKSSLNSAGSYIIGKVVWSYTQSVSGNYSNVTGTLYCKKANDGLALTESTSGKWEYSLDIAAIKKSGYVTKSIGTSWVEICSFTASEIPHNNDGTKIIYITGSVKAPSGSSYAGLTTSGTKYVTLDTIPRASSIGATDANIESTSIIAITRHSSNFTSTVAYKATGQSGYTTIWEKQGHTSYGWTVPAALYSIMANLRQIVIELRCQTYNGDTLIGTTYCTMTATADSEKCQPEATITAKDTRSATVGLTGNNQRIIKGVSTLEATVTSKAKNSASLVNTTVTCGSKSQVGTSNPLVVSFTKAESATASSATKDSRDYVTWKKAELTLINYIFPTANPIVAREGPTSDEVNVRVSGVWFKGSFGAVTNSISAKVRYKLKGEAAYTGGYTNMTVTANDSNYTASVNLSGLDYTNAYDIEIVVSDAVCNGSIEPVITKYDEVRKGIPIFDWGESDFNLNVPLMFNGSLNITEEAEKTNKSLVRKYWWGSSGAVLDTSIPAKGESYGKTILIVLSAHSGTGTATTSEVGMIWCGFDSGTIVYTCLAAISGGSTVSSQFTFTVGANGNIHLKGNRPVISMTAIISD